MLLSSELGLARGLIHVILRGPREADVLVKPLQLRTLSHRGVKYPRPAQGRGSP